jgi:prolyl 4-hydroxylase
MQSIMVPMRFANERLLWSVHDVYTPEECRQFVRWIESQAPTLATNNPTYRDQDRVMLDDPSIAADLLERLRKHLPPTMGELELVGLNPLLRFYRYKSAQRFAPHMDHWYQPDPQHITLHTVLVYFNDDFEGGQTKFQEQLDEVVVPKAGSVALFQHKLRHEGCEVQRGTKYALRSDTIYRAPEGSTISIDFSAG